MFSFRFLDLGQGSLDIGPWEPALDDGDHVFISADNSYRFPF